MSSAVFAVRGWSVSRAGGLNAGPLSFDLFPGQILTLMGQSGVGKTTLLASLLGYQEPGLQTSGERLLDGRRLPNGTIPDDALYIPQQTPFNPNWEIGRYLSLLKHARDPQAQRKQIDREVTSALQEFDLLDRRHATIQELSGGEIQRAALAQLRVLRPRIFVGDEFVTGLDPGMSLWVLQSSRDALKSTDGIGLTVLHDARTATSLSDRIILMWPTPLSVPPWDIAQGTPEWRSDIVHTFLCLSRWLRPGQALDSEALRQLAAELVRSPDYVTLGGRKQWSIVENHVPLAAGVCGTHEISPIVLEVGGQRSAGIHLPHTGNLCTTIVIGPAT